MSVPSTAALSSATAPLLPLITPFVQSGSCASIWATTSLIANGNNVSMLVSDIADAHFAGCQPSGWDAGGASHLLAFSPAVCPSHWTYFDMQVVWTVTQADTSASYIQTNYTTAFCCASGFTRQNDLRSYASVPCVQTTTTVITNNHSATTATLPLVKVHEAWAISWAASDAAILSPSPPDLGGAQVVPTWTPGSLPTGTYNITDPSKNDGGGLNSLFYFLTIGLPIIFIAVCSFVIWFCCWRRKREKKLKLLATRPLGTRDGGEANMQAQR